MKETCDAVDSYESLVAFLNGERRDNAIARRTDSLSHPTPSVDFPARNIRVSNNNTTMEVFTHYMSFKLDTDDKSRDRSCHAFLDSGASSRPVEADAGILAGGPLLLDSPG